MRQPIYFRAEKTAHIGKVRIVVDVLVVLILWSIALGLEYVTPRLRPIDFQDLSINLPMVQKETVPPGALAAVCVVTPLVICLLFGYFVKHNKTDMVVSVFAVLLSNGVTGVITSIIKIYDGGLRPDFLARCARREVAPFDCTGSARLILDGHRSFPSGHASLSAAGLVFLTLYLFSALKTYSRKSQDSSVFKFVLPLLPAISAALIALSRVKDNRHHLMDITVGYILGSIIAFLVYRNYYPWLTHEHCNTPIIALNYANNLDLEAKQESDLSINHTNGSCPRV